MAKDLKEQIEIMTHYLNGGDVEISRDNFKTILGKSSKKNAGDLCWDWGWFDFRIKEQKQKVTIEKWLCRDRQGDFIVIEILNNDNYGLYEKIKLIESYEIEI